MKVNQHLEVRLADRVDGWHYGSSAVAPRYRLGPNDSSNSGNTIEMPSVIHTRR